MNKDTEQVSLEDRLVQQLRGNLNALQKQHRDLRRKTFIQIFLIFLIGGLLALIAIVLDPGKGLEWSLAALFLAMVGALVLVVNRQDPWARTVGAQLMPAICAVNEELKYQSTFEHEQDFFEAFQKLNLIGHYQQPELQHYLRGRHRGRHFELVSARLLQRIKNSGSHKNQTKSFKVLLLRIQSSHDLPARISILPRSRDSVSSRVEDRFREEDMVVIELGDTEFDTIFAVGYDRADPQGEERVRQMLTPDMQKALVAISRIRGPQYLSPKLHVGMMHDSLYLRLQLFKPIALFGIIPSEIPATFAPVRFFLLPDPEFERNVRLMVKDVATIYRIIDQLPSQKEQ